MFERFTRKQKVLLLTLLTIIFIAGSVIILKPYYFYKQPFKLFGYVAYDTTIEDGYAYTTTNEGFYVSKINDDGEIIDNFLYKTDDICFGISIIDGDLFIGYENGNLTQYDISDPTSITEISTIYLDSVILGISSKDDVMYISTGQGYIFSIDIINKTILDTFNISSEYIRDILIYDNYLVYASTNSGVGVLDITDPENLTFFKSISDTSPSFDINIIDDKLFVSRHRNGLKIFEISNQFELSLLQTINTNGEFYSSAFDGTHLVLGNLQEGIEKWIFDEEKNTFTYLETFNKAVPHNLYLLDNLIISADQDRGLFIINLEDMK